MTNKTKAELKIELRALKKEHQDFKDKMFDVLKGMYQDGCTDVKLKIEEFLINMNLGIPSRKILIEVEANSFLPISEKTTSDEKDLSRFYIDHDDNQLAITKLIIPKQE